MKIIETYLEENRCYQQARMLKPQGLMLHSIGVNQSKASVIRNNMNNDTVKVAVHGIIDANTGDVWQTLPWNMRGWHAGGGANNTHIGVEMCEPDGIRYKGGASFDMTGDVSTIRDQVKRTYDAAVELFAFLCYNYSLDPMRDGVIISHSEGYARGVASNHGDPVHLWTQTKMPYTMDGFRKDVEAKFKSLFASQNGSFLIDVVLTDNLPWIRTGPGVQYPHIDGAEYCLKPGRYTIVETAANQWGKLKSGVGWVNLTNKSIKGV